MSSSQSISAQGWILVNQMLDGSIDEPGMSELDAILKSDPLAQKAFVDYCQLHVHLHAELRIQRVIEGFRQDSSASKKAFHPALLGSMQGSADTHAGPPSVVLSSANSFLGRVSAAAGSVRLSLAVILLLLGTFGVGWMARSSWMPTPVVHLQPPSERHREERDSVASSARAVAYLTSVNGCNWDSISRQSQASDGGFGLGDEVALREGIAEFRLANGVSIGIEGPASLLLASPSVVVLQHGKLTARVPWNARDFRLFAGDCRVIATDTEFGIIVDESRIEVHSFNGETHLMPVQLSEDAIDLFDVDDEVDVVGAILPVVVSEGQSAVWLAAGKVQAEERLADRTKFATKLSMGGYLPATQQYVDSVLASHPVSYWRFESIDDGKVSNEVPGAQPLAVVGNVGLSGDFRNRSLELLGSEKEKGHLISDMAVPLSGTDYTIEIWCKSSHFHRGTLVAMGFELSPGPVKDSLRHAVILQTMRNDDRYAKVLANLTPGGIRFLHRNPPTRKPQTGTSCYTEGRYSLRKWQHVVARKEKKTLRIYVDGVMAGEELDPSEIATGLRVMVGEGFFRRSESLPKRSFFGQLDELAIYNRALSEKEIVSHFKAIDFRGPKGPPQIDQAREARHGDRMLRAIARESKWGA